MVISRAMKAFTTVSLVLALPGKFGSGVLENHHGVKPLTQKDDDREEVQSHGVSQRLSNKLSTLARRQEGAVHPCPL